MRIERIEHPQDLSQLVEQDIVQLSVQKAGTLCIALPGGRSAQYIVKGLLSVDKDIQKRIRLYLVDERLEGEHNLDTLVQAGLTDAFALSQLSIPVPGEELPPSLFDKVYLGVGEDGHIASLFPGSWPEQEKVQVKVIDRSPKPPNRRATFTFYGFSTLAAQSRIVMLFFGEGKRDALARLLGGKEQADTLPCAFFRDKRFSTLIITDLKE